SLILGYKLKEGAYLLALYTFLATIMFHVGEGQLGAFLKNLAIIGGLIALAQLPSGKFSLDSKN
ncbi:MAG: DoxX family protein, partial [Nanoarchaeota archaeon]|nr:DoxX family protein [Nanoarchaeota archaeon]MEC8339139.1 DoxX family protein [Nanoarchaeota archaeon]